MPSAGTALSTKSNMFSLKTFFTIIDIIIVVIIIIIIIFTINIIIIIFVIIIITSLSFIDPKFHKFVLLIELHHPIIHNGQTDVVIHHGEWMVLPSV